MQKNFIGGKPWPQVRLLMATRRTPDSLEGSEVHEHEHEHEHEHQQGEQCTMQYFIHF